MNINLADFFSELQKENYCIAKRSDIERCKKGTDIDIFCMDLKSCSEVIINSSRKYIDKGYRLKIDDRSDSHRHIDLLKEKEMELRFDLYSGIPNYKKVNIKSSLLTSVMENKVSESLIMQDKRVVVYYPSLVDEVLLRYLEYIENYELYPDKVRHLDYILKELDNDESLKTFLDKLHYYTAQPKIVITRKNLLDQVTSYIEFIIQGTKLTREYLRNYGLFATLKKIKSKFF
jgi:hypothetical protein